MIFCPVLSYFFVHPQNQFFLWPEVLFHDFLAFSALAGPHAFRRAVQEGGSPGAELAPRPTPRRRAARADHARHPTSSHPRFVIPTVQKSSENSGHFNEPETISSQLPAAASTSARHRNADNFSDSLCGVVASPRPRCRCLRRSSSASRRGWGLAWR